MFSWAGRQWRSVFDRPAGSAEGRQYLFGRRWCLHRQVWCSRLAGQRQEGPLARTGLGGWGRRLPPAGWAPCVAWGRGPHSWQPAVPEQCGDPPALRTAAVVAAGARIIASSRVVVGIVGQSRLDGTRRLSQRWPGRTPACRAGCRGTAAGWPNAAGSATAGAPWGELLLEDGGGCTGGAPGSWGEGAERGQRAGQEGAAHGAAPAMHCGACACPAQPPLSRFLLAVSSLLLLLLHCLYTAAVLLWARWKASAKLAEPRPGGRCSPRSAAVGPLGTMAPGFKGNSWLK